MKDESMKFSTLLILLLPLAVLVTAACHSGRADSVLPGTITFQGACREGEEITIAAVGDIMMHDIVQLSASLLMDPAAGGPDARIVSGFTRLFEKVQPDLDRADLLLGNLETPIAKDLVPEFYKGPDGLTYAREIEVAEGILYDGRAYGRTLLKGFIPNFNAHPLLASALCAAGWDVVSTANNHALDRAVNGVDSTIDALREAGLAFTGTIRHDEIVDSDGDGRPDDTPYALIEIQGVRVAFLAFANLVNGILGLFGVPDTCYQVSRFYDNFLREEEERVTEAVAKARSEGGADLVVVSAHWGFEYREKHDPAQRAWARALVDSGADIILGHHPHVLQPMEKLIAADGREAVVFYSLGNFISALWRPELEATAIVYIGVKRSEERTFVAGVQYVPVEIAEEMDPKTGEEMVRPLAIDRSGGSRASRERVVRSLGLGNLKAPDAPIDYPCECM